MIAEKTGFSMYCLLTLVWTRPQHGGRLRLRRRPTRKTSAAQGVGCVLCCSMLLLCCVQRGALPRLGALAADADDVAEEARARRQRQ